MKINYNEVLKKTISSLDHKPTLLLHSCCGPCSTEVIDVLKDNFLITVLYYNPNIEPESEYLKRKEEQIRFLKMVNIPLLDIGYNNFEF